MVALAKPPPYRAFYLEEIMITKKCKQCGKEFKTVLSQIKIDKRKKIKKISGWHLINAGLVLFAFGFAYYFLSGGAK